MDLKGPTRDLEGSLAQPPLGHARHPPGFMVAPLVAPSGLYYPPGVKSLKRGEFGVSPPPRGGNLQRRKSHLRRADSAGEITSRKGRSSPSSSSSSRVSSRSSSTSSPTSAPSPPPSHLISQLQLIL